MRRNLIALDSLFSASPSLSLTLAVLLSSCPRRIRPRRTVAVSSPCLWPLSSASIACLVFPRSQNATPFLTAFLALVVSSFSASSSSAFMLCSVARAASRKRVKFSRVTSSLLNRSLISMVAVLPSVIEVSLELSGPKKQDAPFGEGEARAPHIGQGGAPGRNAFSGHDGSLSRPAVCRVWYKGRTWRSA